MFETVDEHLGPEAALVNNAGILERQARIDEITSDRLSSVLGTNINGCFLCSREAIRRMSSRYGGKRGATVNASSTASRLGSPGECVDYAASKGAVDTLTTGLSKEVAAEDILRWNIRNENGR